MIRRDGIRPQIQPVQSPPANPVQPVSFPDATPTIPVEETVPFQDSTLDSSVQESQHQVQSSLSFIDDAVELEELPDPIDTSEQEETFRQSSATQTLTTLNLSQTMNGAQYSQFMRSNSQTRLSAPGLYNQAIQQFNTQVSQLEQQITALQAQEPPNLSEIAKLEKLKQLNQSLADTFTHLSQGQQQGISGRYQDSGKVLQSLSQAQELLSRISPEDLGVETHQALDQQLRGLSQLSQTFPTLSTNPNTVNDLDRFTLQTNRRVQQIRDGVRVRDNETPDYSGALQSFENDMGDQQKIVQGIAEIDQQLLDGKFSSVSEYRDAIGTLVKNNTQSFQRELRNLATAKWNTFQIHRTTERTQIKLESAAEYLQEAYQDVEALQEKLTQIQELGQQSVTALQNGDNEAAQSATQEALQLQAEVQQTFDNFSTLRQEILSRTGYAKTERLSRFQTNASSTNEQIKNGPHGHLLEHQSIAIDHTLSQVGTIQEHFNTSASHIESNLNSLSEHQAKLSEWNDQITSRLRIADMTTKVNTMVASGIADTRKKINDTFKEFQGLVGDDYTDNIRRYLEDPTQIPADDRADVREELTELFENHPRMILKASELIGTLRSEIGTLRNDLAGDEQALNSLTMMENQLVEGWLNENGILIQALIAASDETAMHTQFTDPTVNWIRNSQDAVAQLSLGNAEMAQANVEAFNSALSNPQMAEINERVTEIADKYGPAKQTIPMALMMEDTGRLMKFNAYIHQDSDGEYKILNPLDKRVYSGDSIQEAMDELLEDTRIAKGKLHYRMNDQLHTQPVDGPSNSIWADIGMGVVGIAGGILLAFPEPTTATKWAGGAMLGSSSAYFTAKGTAKIVDLVQHETFGNNAQTYGAVFEVATGLLGSVRSAGVLMQAGKARSVIAQSLMKLNQSAGMVRADYAMAGIDLGFASHQLAEIYTNDQLSDSEKMKMGAQVLSFALIPLALSPAQRILSRGKGNLSPADVDTAHTQYNKAFENLDGILSKSSANSPQAVSTLNTATTKFLKDARAFYTSDAVKQSPQIRQEGLRQLAKIDKQIKLLEATQQIDLNATTRQWADHSVTQLAQGDAASQRLAQKVNNEPNPVRRAIMLKALGKEAPNLQGPQASQTVRQLQDFFDEIARMDPGQAARMTTAPERLTQADHAACASNAVWLADSPIQWLRHNQRSASMQQAFGKYQANQNNQTHGIKGQGSDVAAVLNAEVPLSGQSFVRNNLNQALNHGGDLLHQLSQQGGAISVKSGHTRHALFIKPNAQGHFVLHDPATGNSSKPMSRADLELALKAQDIEVAGTRYTLDDAHIVVADGPDGVFSRNKVTKPSLEAKGSKNPDIIALFKKIDTRASGRQPTAAELQALEDGLAAFTPRELQKLNQQVKQIVFNNKGVSNWKARTGTLSLDMANVPLRKADSGDGSAMAHAQKTTVIHELSHVEFPTKSILDEGGQPAMEGIIEYRALLKSGMEGDVTTYKGDVTDYSDWVAATQHAVVSELNARGIPDTPANRLRQTEVWLNRDNADIFVPRFETGMKALAAQASQVQKSAREVRYAMEAIDTIRIPSKGQLSNSAGRFADRAKRQLTSSLQSALDQLFIIKNNGGDIEAGLQKIKTKLDRADIPNAEAFINNFRTKLEAN